MDKIIRISKLRLVLSILFVKGFFSHPLGGLEEVIKYAVNNYQEKRGEGAADVVTFIARGHYELIKKKN